MSHVFISYSKKNRAYARVLADHLLSLGFDVWIDDRIDYGEMWERTIFKAIDDCAAFLIIMTPDSYQSDWVLREIQYADRRHKPQFPVLLDGEDFPRYGPHQHVDVRGGILPPEDFYKRLEQAAPRKAQIGVNVTPAEAAISPTDTLPKTPAAPSTKSSSGLNSRTTIIIGVGILAAILVVGLLLLNRQSASEATINTLSASTATLQQQVTTLSTLLTAEVTQEVVNAPSLTLTPTTAPSSTPKPSPSVTPSRTATPKPTATVTRTPTDTPTVDIAMAVNTLDAEATIHVSETNNAATATQRAVQTATAASWTDTPTPTATLTPNITASIEAYLTQRAAHTATAITAFQTATAASWTDTPTPTPNVTSTPTSTFTNTPTPTLQGGGTGQIAFISIRNHNSEIYAMNINSTELRQLTNNARPDELSWSPDGRRIAFSSTSDVNYEIYVMDADGTNLRNLTNNSANDISPAWSPDGSQIAFRSNRAVSPQVYVMNADGSNVHQLTNTAEGAVGPTWSPDGNQIAFAANPSSASEIYVVNADGSNPHNLTNNPADDFSPAWSPDGRQIAFRSDRDGRNQIYVMNADGSNQRNISNNPANDYAPSWRPAAPYPDPLLSVPIIDTTQSPTQTVIAPTVQPTSTPVPTYDSLVGYSVIFHISNYQRVNARSGPGSQYSVTGGANPGSKGGAIYLSTDGQWVYAWLLDINYFGWVKRDFIVVEQGDLSSLPRNNVILK